MATDPGIVVVPKHLLSRLLYTNPVCLLTSHDPATRRRNVMTISWLTAINNQGGFICSMNAKRATAPIVQAAGGFVLNVPVRGMEPLVLGVGGCHGDDTDKFERFGLTVCAPGWRPLAGTDADRVADALPGAIALTACAAQLVCKIQHTDLVDGHLLLRGVVCSAYVRTEYWTGKTFRPRAAGVPPYLTFFGSREFGYVAACEVDQGRSAPEGE